MYAEELSFFAERGWVTRTGEGYDFSALVGDTPEAAVLLAFLSPQGFVVAADQVWGVPDTIRVVLADRYAFDIFPLDDSAVIRFCDDITPDNAEPVMRCFHLLQTTEAKVCARGGDTPLLLSLLSRLGRVSRRTSIH